MDKNTQNADVSSFHKLFDLRLQDLRSCAFNEVERLEQSVSELAEENKRLQALLTGQAVQAEIANQSQVAVMEDADTEMENLLQTMEFASNDGRDSTVTPPNISPPHLPDENKDAGCGDVAVPLTKNKEPTSKSSSFVMSIPLKGRVSGARVSGRLSGRNSGRSSLKSSLIKKSDSQCSLNSRNFDMCVPDPAPASAVKVLNGSSDGVQEDDEEAGTLSWRFNQDVTQQGLSRKDRPLPGISSGGANGQGIMSYIGSHIGLWGAPETAKK